MYWLLSTSVREKLPFGYDSHPLPLCQVVLSHRSRGEWFAYTRENTGVLAADHEARHAKAAEEVCKDVFRHDPTSWMDLVHQLDARSPGPASGYPVIVMVQPTHDW